MALYARSDLACTVIPIEVGGCGSLHSRPVINGAPAKQWKLECEPCEAVLRGDRKPKIIQVTPGDKDRGIPSRMVHVADAHPHFSSTPEGVPLTPDEEHIHHLRSQQGRQQLDMLQAYAALSKVEGLDLKDFREAMWLLDQTLDPLKRPVIEGETVCADGHSNPAGKKFCGECGMRMDAKATLESAPEPEPEPVPAEDLYRLHVATLRKRCRQKDLPDKGSKEALIARLQAA